MEASPQARARATTHAGHHTPPRRPRPGRRNFNARGIQVGPHRPGPSFGGHPGSARLSRRANRATERGKSRARAAAILRPRRKAAAARSRLLHSLLADKADLICHGPARAASSVAPMRRDFTKCAFRTSPPRALARPQARALHAGAGELDVFGNHVGRALRELGPGGAARSLDGFGFSHGARDEGAGIHSGLVPRDGLAPLLIDVARCELVASSAVPSAGVVAELRTAAEAPAMSSTERTAAPAAQRRASTALRGAGLMRTGRGDFDRGGACAIAVGFVVAAFLAIRIAAVLSLVPA